MGNRLPQLTRNHLSPLHRLAKGNPRVLEELLIELASREYQLDESFDRKLLDHDRQIHNATDLAVAQLAGKKRLEIHMNWFTWSLLSAVFAALTAICAKVGIEGIDSNLATAIRTTVILFVGWALAFATTDIGAISSLSKRTLAVSGPFRIGNRAFVGVLFPRAANGRSVKSGSSR